MDCIVNGVAKSQTRLGDFHFTLLYRTNGITICAFKDAPNSSLVPCIWWYTFFFLLKRGLLWSGYRVKMTKRLLGP